MSRFLSYCIVIFFWGLATSNTTLASEYTNLKQALKHPEDVTVLKLSIHDVSKKYQNKTFPIDIGKMINIERIEINTTTFTGFPSEISNCKKLNTIVLMGNFEFPTEISVLEIDTIKWSISKEKLNIIPEATYSINSLKHLDITHQNITAVSGKFNQLKNLEYLNLSNNQITTIEEVFGEIEKLKYLYLSNNQITNFPIGLQNTLHLKELILNDNLITKLPAFSFELPEINKFEYQNNPITAESLLEIAEKKQDKFHIYCSVDGEKNTTIQEIINNASNIIMLSIHGKKNAEIFMEHVDKFYSLVYLELSGDIVFTYEIKNLVKVQNLRQMVYTPLNGKIPAGFSTVKQINSFVTDLGEFSKVMPLVLFEMTQLKELHFSAFNLEYIPTEISELTNLESLTINGNFKTIPEVIGTLPKLKSVTINSEFISLVR